MFRSLSIAALASVALLCVGVSIPSPAQAQGTFDCRRPSQPYQRVVCADPSLKAADLRLSEAIADALRVAEDPDRLRLEQQEWTLNLRNCSTDTLCLRDFYSDRTETLRDRVSRSAPIPVSEPAQIATVEGLGESGTPIVEVTAQVEPTSQVEDSAVGPLSAPIHTIETTEVGEPAPAQAPADRIEPSSDVPAENRGKVGNWEKMLGGSLLLVPVVAVILALLATKSLAEYTSRRFNWPLIMNWWNVLYLVGYFGAWFAASLGGMMAAFGFFGAACLIVLVVNVSKTNLVTGVAMTLVQPFVVAILWVLYGITKAKAEGRRI